MVLGPEWHLLHTQEGREALLLQTPVPSQFVSVCETCSCLQTPPLSCLHFAPKASFWNPNFHNCTNPIRLLLIIPALKHPSSSSLFVKTGNSQALTFQMCAMKGGTLSSGNQSGMQEDTVYASEKVRQELGEMSSGRSNIKLK